MKPASQPVISAEIANSRSVPGPDPRYELRPTAQTNRRRETAIRLATGMLAADIEFTLEPGMLAALAINHADALLDELDRRDRMDQAEADLANQRPA